MKLFISHLLLLLVISIPSFSQQTKKIVEESGEKYSKVKKIYYVLTDDQTIKHGPYQLYFTGKLTITGFYKMDKKDSVWQRYDTKGSVVSRKIYTENKRTGIWEFYNNYGAFDWQYDFKKDSFLNKPQGSPDYSYQSLNGEWVKGKADRDPVWLRSIYEWQSYLNRTLRYPGDALDQNKQGKVSVEITLDENGDAIDYSIGESVFPSLDAEAIRLFKIFQPEFLPAVKDGKKVKTKIQLPISFRLG